jgi:hypothetical protein
MASRAADAAKEAAAAGFARWGSMLAVGGGEHASLTMRASRISTRGLAAMWLAGAWATPSG